MVVLHKTVINETSTDVLPDIVETTESVFISLSEKNDSIEIDVNTTTTMKSLPVSVSATTEKQVFNESTVVVHVENSTISVSTKYETSTMMIETTVELTTTAELTTTEETTSTFAVPADCPVLKDCPFDYCAFARKFDNRGCPTCNCLHSNKSSITCLTLTCQACLYGHYTDSNGVCISLFKILS